jgi:HEAT repeat protein
MLWWTLQQLKSSNWETRAAAAAQLQASNQHKGVPALIKALDDENAQVRLAVINALAALAHPAAAEPLATALSGLSQRAKSARAGSENAEYEAMAVALGRLDGAAVPPLMHLLDSAEREVRRWAAHALGLTRDPRAVDPLVSLLSDSRS